LSALLVISCSERKLRRPRRPIPAIERYDGVFYRLLRKARREGILNADITIVILSARFGMLTTDSPIPYYDQSMNTDRLRVLQPSIRRGLKRLLLKKKFDQVYVNLGRSYAPAVEPLSEIRNAVWASGGIGQRAQLMKRWLTTERQRSDRLHP
jgi:hypothetical protein